MVAFRIARGKKAFTIAEELILPSAIDRCREIIGEAAASKLQMVVVIQFLSGVVPLAEMAGFTPFLLQLLALCPSTCLISGHPLSSNQSSLSPLPPAFPGLFWSSSLFLATHFKIQSNLQNTIVIPLQHMSYHLTQFAVAYRSIVSFNPNMSICSSFVFLSTTF